ncbi:MAG: xanthine dehydrogenase family protein molybdopterin-binding subunit [Bauldia litoralis]
MLLPPRTDGHGTAPDRWIGRSRPRVEDARLVTGRGRFVDDVASPNCLHVAFVRSTAAHGRLASINTQAASSAPGVRAVFAGEDVRGLGELPVNPLIDTVQPPPFFVLAQETVFAVGQPIAAVVADTLAAAVAAADLVDVDNEAIEPAAGGSDPACPAPLFSSLIDDRAFEIAFVEGDPDAAFAAATETVSVSVDHPRVAPFTLEPRSIHVVFDSGDPALTVWLPSQAPQRARRDLATILGIDPARIRVIAPDVGGAFGMKASLYPEDALVAWAALTLRRSVKWTASRAEELLAATQGRGLSTEAQAALDGDGRITALRARIGASLGHWMPFSGVVPARNAARILPGPYRVPAVDIAAEGRVTAQAAAGIYRGAGRPEAAVLMERLMDAAARKTGLDPVELRRRNLIPPEQMPFSTRTGEILDSGDYPALLERACAAADYPGLRARQAREREAGKLFGVGVAFYVEPCGVGWETGKVRLEANGRVTAATGSSAQGQGRETVFAQIVADALCLAPGRIDVVYGDTAEVPEATGALASRSTGIGGSAIQRAALELRDRARALAARLLQCSPDAIALDQGGFRVDGHDDAALDWAALAGAVAAEHGNPEAGPALEANVRFEASGETWAYGCCIASLTIDADTGAARIERMVWVDDAGVVVNPDLAEDQLVGGLAQGLGQALMEEIVYDEDGQLVTGSLMDYALPRADDMPDVILDQMETPALTNPLGAKGIGEAGCIGAPAAILNAALDALAPLGVRHLDLPLTSGRIWHAMKDARNEDRKR